MTKEVAIIVAALGSLLMCGGAFVREASMVVGGGMLSAVGLALMFVRGRP